MGVWGWGLGGLNGHINIFKSIYTKTCLTPTNHLYQSNLKNGLVGDGGRGVSFFLHISNIVKEPLDGIDHLTLT